MVEGSDVAVDCDNLPDGEPYRLQWKFNEKPYLPPNHNIKNFGDGLFILSLINVGSENSGKYTCIDLNSGQRDDGTVKIIGGLAKTSFSFY